MEFLQVLPVLLFSVVVHEVAHAWVARREGDDTAERLGRITLNPIPHLDVIGSFLLPLALHFSGTGFLFGWAKPVPVDTSKLRDPVWSDIKVSLAGVVSNFILAALFAVLAVLLFRLESATGQPWIGGFASASLVGIWLNLLLAFFNLLPIPPLDGSHVVAHMLPKPLARSYRELGRYGLIILIALFYFGGGVTERFLWGPFRSLLDVVLSTVMQFA